MKDEIIFIFRDSDPKSLNKKKKETHLHHGG